MINSKAMDINETLSDKELIKLYIDPMSINEFKEWIKIPCSIDDLFACYDYYENLPQTSLNIEKLILIDDLIMDKILDVGMVIIETPHRVSDN